MRTVKRFAVLSATLSLCACAPTQPPVDDGCANQPYPEDRPVLAFCEWPEGMPLPAAAPKKVVVAAHEGEYAPGTLVMPGHPDVLDHGPRTGTMLALTFD